MIHPQIDDPPIEVIERLATLQEWIYDRYQDDEISILIKGLWSHYNVSVAWLPEMEALQFSCSFDLKVPERKRGAISELLCLINAKLWIGHFDVSSEENLILFRQALLLSGEARINETQALALVEAAVKACDTYFQSFQFVLWAGRSPREAVDFAMFETVGRA